MKDLTKGSPTRHLLRMAFFIGAGLLVQTLYYLIDLYFVSRLGRSAIAGVSAASASLFLAMAASQVVTVGCLSLTSQAVGAKRVADANIVVHQAIVLAVLLGVATLIVGYSIGGRAMAAVAADHETLKAARTYLAAFLPALAFAFPTAAIGAALNSIGVVRPIMIVQTATVLLNAALAPVLVSGWGSGIPLGIFGAGLASSISAGAGTLTLFFLFPRVQGLLRISARHLVPRTNTLAQIAGIGLPAAGEFILMFAAASIAYWAVRDFGAEVQAGFGIGSRVIQSLFLPAIAVACAVEPIAGQNFGAGHYERVRATFHRATIIILAMMMTLTWLCQALSDVLVRPFADDPATATVASGYLRTISWNFVCSGYVFACSALFQALGVTFPVFAGSAVRLATFALPAIWLSLHSDDRVEHVWWASIASVTVHAIASWLLLRGVLRQRLVPSCG